MATSTLLRDQQVAELFFNELDNCAKHTNGKKIKLNCLSLSGTGKNPRTWTSTLISWEVLLKKKRY